MFGTGGQYTYDPLPVTKRFIYQVDNNEITNALALPPPPLLLSGIKEAIRGVTNGLLLDGFPSFLHSKQWTQEVRPLSRDNSTHKDETNTVSVYHYLRSKKECLNERGQSSNLCSGYLWLD